MWKPHNLEQSLEDFTIENIEFLKKKEIREGLHLEFKERFSKKLEPSLCAYLNTDGGWLILGVEEKDEKIRKIVGISEDFVQEFRKSFKKFDPYIEWDPDIHLKEITLNSEKSVFIIKIPKSKHSHKLSGLFYIRIGAETIKLTRDSEIIQLKKEKGEVDELGREIQRYRKLPQKNYDRFIGREEIYKEIIKELNNHHRIISIDGIGGVGKSTLALEIAINCFERRLFDSVLWFSAKREKLAISQITTTDPEFENLDNLLEKIAYELKIDNYEMFADENKINMILKLLKNSSILLVLDNLETIKFTEDFIDFLASVEGKSKILITSRKRIGQIERIISLSPFSYEDTKEFIIEEAEERSFLSSGIKEEMYKELYSITNGIPLAIKVLMGWLVEGVPLVKLKEKIKTSDTGILKFLFEETYETQLLGKSKLLLVILSILPNDISDGELAACVDFDSEELEELIGDLINYSLISRAFVEDDNEGDTIYFKMQPLTRIFGYSKSGDFKNLERKILKKYTNVMSKKTQFLSDLEILKSENNLVGLNSVQKNAYIKALRASKIFEDGDYATALNLFREAEKICDDIPELYFLWAKVESSLGHFRITDELYERCIKLNPNNPTYWLLWASFHKQNKNNERAKEILNNSLSHIPLQKQHIVRRELGIILNRLQEFNHSLEILKENLINNPTKENDYIINTKTMSSILTTYIYQGRYHKRIKKLEIAEKKFKNAEEFYDNNVNLINVEDPGLVWRTKQLFREIANTNMLNKFNLAQEYYGKAYYKTPKTKREKTVNTAFLKDWKSFVRFWKNKGKCNEDFLDIFEGGVYRFNHKIWEIQEAISFEEALKCLLESILFSQERGKTTRLARIDILMRRSPKYKYDGALSVLKPDNSGIFASFSEFIQEVELTGKIRIQLVEGFKELFIV